MFAQVNEYTIIKDILDKNSDFIKIFESNQRVKTIDCQVMHTMISDLYRFKTAMKVEDEDYIFVRRAINNKSNLVKDKKEKNN